VSSPSGLATLAVPTFPPDTTAGTVQERMVGRSFDRVEEVAVVAEGHLLGLVGLEDILEADPGASVSNLMDDDPVTLGPDGSEEEAAWQMARKGQANLAVVDARGYFAGLIPAHLLLGRLLTELDEDSARLGGYVASTDRARLAAEERVSRRLLHRLPWLVIGLFGAMLSAVIVGSFEDQLNEKVLLAFFVPAVVYMADAVGTQTETLLIRGMSANINVKMVVRREMLTGILLGLLVGAAFYPFALLGWGDQSVALAVSLALFASCSISTSVATVLPRLIAKFGGDPAFGSGPLATIVQDLLSIAVYLVIATSIAT
jgi:magnesium transporter